MYDGGKRAVGRSTLARVKLTIEVSCPCCYYMKAVRNGVKKTGKQNLLCNDCRLHFQVEYQNKGADQGVKEKLIKMLLRGSGVRGCASVPDLSLTCVLCTVLKEGAGLEIKPKHRHYERVQIDEQGSYAKEKKRKVWMIYAICAGSGEILTTAWASATRPELEGLMLKLRGLEIGSFCTDDWQAFAEVLPKKKHLIGSSLQRR